METKRILSVENLNKYFKSRGVLKHALNDISFSVDEGDFFGIIGESGSGKTTLGKAIIRLLDVSGGNVYFLNRNISTKKISKSKRQWLANNMQMIFQDPLSSLNPNMNIIKLISEPLEISKEIVKKVKEVVDYKVIFNSYYKYDFLLRTKKVVSENTVKFYETYNRILNNEIKNSGNFKFSNKESWVSSYNEVEKIYDDILSEQKNLVPFLENIINHNSTVLERMLVQLEKKELDEVFLKYYELKTSEKTDLKAIEEAKKAYENAKEELLAFKKEYEDIATKRLLKNDLRDEDFSYKFNHTNSSLAKTKIEHLRFKLLADEAKIKKDLLKRTFDYKYIEESKCNIGLKEIFEYIDKIYRSADFEINKIDSLKTYVSSLQLISNKFEYSKISSKVFSIFETKIHPKFLKLDTLSKTKYDQFVAKKEIEINSLLNKYNSIKQSMKVESQKEFARKERESQKLLLQVEKAASKYRAAYEKFLDWDYKTSTIKIQELKSKNSELKKTVHQIVAGRLKMLLELQPESLKSFTPKEKSVFLKNNRKTFKTQLKLKKSALQTIDWEYANTIESTKLYEDLFSTSREVLKLHKNDLIKLLTLEEIYKALESVGLKKEHAYRYPHEFSGGQRQRIVIARALINDPKLIIADEAISALDVSVQAQVINIMKDFSIKRGMTFLFIAHDLSMVRNICNKVIIMHNGRIVEKGLVSKVFENPIHPYTVSLFKAIPEVDKMHIDLAMFNVTHDYDKFYSSSNMPKFYEISPGHEVLATEKQFQKWAK